MLDINYTALSLQVKIPKMMVGLGLRMIRKTILNKAKFDIKYASVGISFCLGFALFSDATYHT